MVNYNKHYTMQGSQTSTKNPRISYKEITKERLEWCFSKQIQLTTVTVQPDKGGYIRDNLTSVLDNSAGLKTIAVNVGTGRGKTTAIYNHIANLQSNKKAISILATPFRQLVNKDHNGLKDAGVSPSNITSYLDVQKANGDLNALSEMSIDIKDLFLKNYINDRTVHVISINSLLRNPGTEAYDLRQSMRIYLDLLHKHYTKNNLEVHLFIDEIHESVDNLQSKYLSALWNFKPYLSKVVVSSATFSEPALTALSGITSITNNNLLLYQKDRTKFLNSSCPLHLIFTKKNILQKTPYY